MTEPGAEESKAAPLSAVVIRSIRPEDAAGLHAFHGRLSDDTIRNRFLGPHPVLRDAEAHRFTALARGEGAALVAIVDEVIVAAGRYVRLSGGDAAEVAFVVEDPYQCRGIGTALLTLLAHIAWDDGIRHLVADTFATNRAMLDVFMHTPHAVTVMNTRRDGSVVHLVMGVVPPDSMLSSASEPAGLPARSRHAEVVGGISGLADEL
jgi:RimJ/RimL family protein N-acetyltransferase